MANEEHVDIDDLHNEEEIIETPEGVENELEQDELESNFENEGDDPETDKGTEEGGADEKSVLSGTEKFLAQYGILGGMIEFEDGTKKHYDELDQDEQFNVLKSIAEGSKSPVEAEYDLEGEEIQLLNYIREQNKPVAEVIQDMVDAQIQKIEALRSVGSEDFVNMTSDSVYLKWLANADPEATAEDLQEALEAAKKSRTFEKTADNIRKGFIQDQDRLIEAEQVRLEQEQSKELEADRETIVNQVQDIKHVAGWDVTDDQKNEVLGSLLEVNSQGDSLFMEEVFSDPKILFEVAWLKKFGAAYFDEMANYYKNQISESYKRGKNEGMSGLPGKPISFSTQTSEKPIAKSTQNRDNVNAVDIDDLHQD